MSLLRSAGSISAWTLMSRILGLFRDVLTTHVLGVNWISGTFVLAWMLPNMLRRLFGEGALSAAFVPAFTRRLQKDGQEQARGLLASVSGSLLLGLGIVSGLVVLLGLLMPPESWGLDPVAAAGSIEGASSAERGALLGDLLAILFPYALPVCLVAVYAGTGHALSIFAPAAAAPALLNVFWIGALVFIWRTGMEDLTDAVRLIAAALLVGGLAQLALVATPLAKHGFLPKPRLPKSGDGAKQVFKAMGPTVIGMSVVQLNLLVDQGIAYGLVGPESNNHIFLANRLLLFPHALIALPLATAVFPAMAADAGRADMTSLRNNLDKALSVTLFMALPATAGLCAISGELIDVAFVHGRYTHQDGLTTAATTIALVLGLPALGISQLYARALYALGHTKAPARIAAKLVLVNLGLNLLFVLGFGFGVAGLTAATSICTWINAFALSRELGKEVGKGDHISSSSLRLLWTSAAMFGLLWLLPKPSTEAGRLDQALFGVLLPVVVGMVFYALLHIGLRSPEWQALKQRLSAKLRRK